MKTLPHGVSELNEDMPYCSLAALCGSCRLNIVLQGAQRHMVESSIIEYLGQRVRSNSVVNSVGPDPLV